MPPLRKTGPDLRKRRGQGLLDLNQCPQSGQIRRRRRTAASSERRRLRRSAGWWGGGFEPFKTVPPGRRVDQINEFLGLPQPGVGFVKGRR
jgi:hypothetical protein